MTAFRWMGRLSKFLGGVWRKGGRPHWENVHAGLCSEVLDRLCNLLVYFLVSPQPSLNPKRLTLDSLNHWHQFHFVHICFLFLKSGREGSRNEKKRTACSQKFLGVQKTRKSAPFRFSRQMSCIALLSCIICNSKCYPLLKPADFMLLWAQPCL